MFILVLYDSNILNNINSPYSIIRYAYQILSYQVHLCKILYNSNVEIIMEQMKIIC